MKANNKQKRLDRELQKAGGDKYLAPPPPKGRIVGIDAHPGIHTAVVVTGTTPHDMKVHERRKDLDTEQLLRWLGENFGPVDFVLLEASGNSFALYAKVTELGIGACVLESEWVGDQADKRCDDDLIAAERICKVYLQGDCPAVWVPDQQTIERRSLLSYYEATKRDMIQASNSFRCFLQQHLVDPGKRNLALKKHIPWIFRQRAWSPAEQLLLQEYIDHLSACAMRRKRIERQICAQVSASPQMLGLMSILGIGKINAFAAVAIIGDVHRFSTPRKLVKYLGLCPGRRKSGKGKNVKTGIGNHGCKDLRCLLMQGAHAVLRLGSASSLGKWGLGLMLRKGQRNIAVSAVARKLAAQVRHLLKGNKPDLLEPTKSREIKFTGLLTAIGKELRPSLGLSGTIAECIELLDQRINLLKNQRNHAKTT